MRKPIWEIEAYTSEPPSGEADFATTPSLDQYYHHAVIAEWSVDAADSSKIDPASRRELMRADEPQFNHDGGTIQFGPDGFLYIALGDGGNADDQGPAHSAIGNGQDTSNILGNLLRIDVEGTNSANGNYGIPPDNPFVSTPAISEIYA